MADTLNENKWWCPLCRTVTGICGFDPTREAFYCGLVQKTYSVEMFLRVSLAD